MTHKPKVLIVDDNRTNVDLLERQFTRKDFEVAVARDGEEALSQARAFRPDVMILDLMLPKIEGLEVCRILKQEPASSRIQIIMLTAKSELADKIRGLDSGADDYLTKPFNFDELLARANAALRMKEVLDELLAANDRLKNTQAQLVQSGKLAAIGELSAGIAHEINNPIAIILGRVQLALKQLDRESAAPPEFLTRYRQLLGTVEAEAKRCKSIIENLLRFSRQQASETGPTRLNDVMLAAAAFFRYQLKNANIDIVEELSGDLPVITANANQLQQVLVNLIINAKQVMPSGGILTLRSFAEPEFLCLSVGDTGKGIPPELHDRVFEPFFTTKEAWQGTGLGLSVSYRIVQEHGGHFELDSAPGNGARFTVKLPRPHTA